MPFSDETQIGGAGGGFPVTNWSGILGARSAESRRELAIAIANQYWKPVYCYLRHKGYTNEQAKDLTQGFFCDVVIERDLVQQADPAKGKFRTLLLAALNRFAISCSRHDHAAKRAPVAPLVSLDSADAAAFVPDPAATPEQTFTCAWVADLLEHALGDVERGCKADGLDVHWQVFRQTVVESAMTGRPSPLAEVCTRLGIESQAKASNMAVTVKRRFQAALWQRVRARVQRDDQVEGEIRELMAHLASPAGVPRGDA